MYAGGEALGGSEQITAEKQVADLVPVDLAGVEPESDPAARADIGWDVVSLGLRRGERSVLAG